MIGERPPLEERHHEVGKAPLLTDLMDRDDMGVIDACHGPALPQKALAGGRLDRLGGKHHLDRHVAVESFIVGQPYPPHPPAAEETDDAVASDCPWSRRLLNRNADDDVVGVAVGDVPRLQHDRLRLVASMLAGILRGGADHEGAERIPPEHAGGFLDLHHLAVVAGHAADQALGQPAQPSCGGINEMELAGIVADRLENRWLGTGILRPNQRVDDPLGLLDEIEQVPPGIDGRAGHLEEVGGEKLAEPLDDVREALARGVSDRPQHGDGVVVRVDAGGEISLGRRRWPGGLPGATVWLKRRAA